MIYYPKITLKETVIFQKKTHVKEEDSQGIKVPKLYVLCSFATLAFDSA